MRCARASIYYAALYDDALTEEEVSLLYHDGDVQPKPNKARDDLGNASVASALQHSVLKLWEAQLWVGLQLSSLPIIGSNREHQTRRKRPPHSSSLGMALLVAVSLQVYDVCITSAYTSVGWASAGTGGPCKNFGGSWATPRGNVDIVQTVCAVEVRGAVDRNLPASGTASHAQLTLTIGGAGAAADLVGETLHWAAGSAYVAAFLPPTRRRFVTTHSHRPAVKGGTALAPCVVSRLRACFLGTAPSFKALSQRSALCQRSAL